MFSHILISGSESSLGTAVSLVCGIVAQGVLFAWKDADGEIADGSALSG